MRGDRLRELAESGQRTLGDAAATDIIAWVASHFGDRVAVVSSMTTGVLPHLVSRAIPGVDVLFLDTGYHFAATIGTRDAIEATLPVRVVDVRSVLPVADQDRLHGPELFGRDPERCCRIRKVVPLTQRLADYDVWITGLRRDGAETRRDVAKIDFDERHRMVKVNPIADWTLADLQDYAASHGLVVNPMLADGYPSIGCAPCTRRVGHDEDQRAGRWAGLAKTECGIHR